MYVVTPEEIRAIDHRAINKFMIPSIVLMENASIRTLDVIEMEYPYLGRGSKILILAGAGNNGGDGLALSRHFLLKGFSVITALCAPEERFAGDAKINLDIYRKLGGTLISLIDENHLEYLDECIGEAELIVDGIFGTGLSRDIEGVILKAIDMINTSSKPVVAVDIPTGINGEDGKVMGAGIRANHTVTFGYPKRGQLLYPGRNYTGKLHTVLISLPEDSAKALGVKTFVLDDDEIGHRLKERPKEGHKGTFGKVGVIAGSLGMAGAARLTSIAALRGGAGLVTLGCPDRLWPIFQTGIAEVMVSPLEDGGTGHLTKDAIPALNDFIEGKDVLAIGPGLGSKSDGFTILEYILGKISIPIVMDADALNHISKDINLLSNYKGSIVITPHPGEMARLTGKNVEKILQSPIESATEFARKTGTVVLLKGGTSVIAHPDGEVYLNTSGNSGMGTAGSGDVLTGLIAALVAQGYSVFEAAVYGCYIHGRAGDYAKRELGEIGMVAGDILDKLPMVFKDLY
ncbi:MAG: NAD(P)H-hydrate dehydratase [Clostridiales bacterium]|nr:NAD(P)H-hydrate dehydratase [Clostridiales bacterium]